MEKNKRRKNHISEVIFSVSSIILFAKILGFLKQMYIANSFGATGKTDIIFLSQGLITDFEYLLSQTMITAFIPIYISIKAENKKGERNFVGRVLAIFSIVATTISILIFVFAPIIAHFLAPSYDGKMLDGLIKHIRIYAFILVILLFMAVFNALLKANKSFMPGELISINQSVIFVVIVFFMQGSWGENSLVISFFLYAIINCIYLGICSRKYWLGSSICIRRDENVKKLLKMTGPLLFGYALLYINQQIDKILASGLGNGVVTALSYSAVLSNFVSGFIGSISGVIFTYVATHVAEKRHKSAADLVNKMLILFITILLPVTLLTVFNSKEIVSIVYGRGAFSSIAVENTSNALKGYGFVFIPYVIRELFTRLQYSYQDSKLPMINSGISIFVNIFLSVLLSRKFGIFGITISSSISVLCCAVLNIVSSRKHNKCFSLSYFKTTIIVWICGCIGCLATSIIVTSFISVDSSAMIRLIITCTTSILVYVIIVSPVLIKILKEYKKND